MSLSSSAMAGTLRPRSSRKSAISLSSPDCIATVMTGQSCASASMLPASARHTLHQLAQNTTSRAVPSGPSFTVLPSVRVPASGGATPSASPLFCQVVMPATMTIRIRASSAQRFQRFGSRRASLMESSFMARDINSGTV